MYQNIVKRLIDTTVATLLIVISLPLLVVIAGLIKLDSEGPLIFKQTRTGYGGIVFDMYKLRTMSYGNQINDISVVNSHTRIGKFLRMLSLDEIPQLVNVIKGEMSIIGPRPWLPEYFAVMNSRQRGRINVLPGITGYAQISGRNNLSILDKIEADLYYVNRISFILDYKITVMTVIESIKRTGIEIDKLGIHSEINQLRILNGFGVSGDSSINGVEFN